MALTTTILQVRKAIATALADVTVAKGRTMDLVVREAVYDRTAAGNAQAVVAFSKLGSASEQPFGKTVRDVSYRVVLTVKTGTGLSMPLEDYAIQGCAEIERALMKSAAIEELVEIPEVLSIENIPVFDADTIVFEVLFQCRVGYAQDDQFVEEPA